MIQVSVSQHDRIESFESTLLRKMIVIVDLARSLKEAKVNKDVCVPGLDKVGRPGDFASTGAMNRDFHIVTSVPNDRRSAIRRWRRTAIRHGGSLRRR